MNDKLKLNLKYFMIQTLYFGIYSALLGYASVYLLGKGFSNSTIGIALAVSSAIAVFIQPFIATFCDNDKNVKLRKTVMLFLIIMALLSLSILFFKEGTLLLLCIFTGIGTIELTIMPLLNSMAFIFEKYGVEINYGVGRGLGSATYAIVSLALGYLVKDYGINVFPIVYLIFNLILILVVYAFVVPKNRMNEQIKEEETIEEKQLPFLEFCKKYIRFIIFAIGLVFVYFTHILICNFFIQFITPIGGNEKSMGIAVFISAMSELPAMILFNRLRKKIGCTTLIAFAVILFAIKHLLIFLASNMIILYISQILQMLSYAIIIPGGVYYANKVIEKADIVKGQSIVTIAFTVSSILASLIGGLLLDKISTHNVLLIGTIISVIGALIVILSLERKKENIGK